MYIVERHSIYLNSIQRIDRMLPITEVVIHQLLYDLGMFSNMKGFYYLTDLILLACEGEVKIRQMKYGYYKLCVKYEKSMSAIDRGCRYIIDQSYGRHPELYRELFKITTKPTVTMFVFSTVEYLNRESLGGDLVESSGLSEVVM